MDAPKSEGSVTFGEMLAQAEESRPAAARKERDQADMRYYGKRQRFPRNFGLISITGLTTTMMLTWEGSLVGIGPQLKNGGPTGLFVGYLVAWAGSTLQVLVMAEMASMIPLSGGQYNWVAVLSPPSAGSFLSYMVGWLTLLTWQAAGAAITYIVAAIIQYLAAVNHPTYADPKSWQLALIFYGILLMSLFTNVALSRIFPKLEAFALILHVAGFFVVLIIMVYLSPKNSADKVFNQFIDGGGWSSNGLSFFVGLVGSAGAFVGVDSAAHLAEEVSSASSVVPKAMIASMIINGLAGTGMVVALCFCLGSAEDAIQESFAFIKVFTTALGSAGGATGLAMIPLLCASFGALGVLATNSRMVWAFAREGAMPGSRWLGKVHERSALPLYSIALCVFIQLVLATIIIGSTTAFNAFIGLTVEGFYSVFFISASVMLHKRLTTPASAIRWGYFRLGRLGVPITILSMAYTVLVFFFSFWPPGPNPTRETFTWAIVVYLGFVIIAIAFWFIRARHRYTGPIIETDAQEASVYTLSENRTRPSPRLS